MTQGPEITLVGPIPPPWGGVSVHVWRLERALAERGWSVLVFASGRQTPADIGCARLVGNSPWRHVLETARSARGIVHSHHSISVLALVTSLAARAARLPFVQTLHGVPVSVLRRKEGADLFWRLAFRAADATIAVSPHVAHCVRDMVRPERLHVISPYLPPSAEEIGSPSIEFAEWERMLPPGIPLLAASVYRLLSPLHGRKDIYGLEDLAELTTRLVARNRTLFALAVQLALPPSDRDERLLLATATDKLRRVLGERFRLFVGTHAPPVIARSQVLIRCTRTDGDSVIVREALDLGVRVLASDAAPRPEGVATYRTGDLDDMTARAAAVLESLPPFVTRTPRLAPRSAPGLETHIALFGRLQARGAKGTP